MVLREEERSWRRNDATIGAKIYSTIIDNHGGDFDSRGRRERRERASRASLVIRQSPFGDTRRVAARNVAAGVAVSRLEQSEKTKVGERSARAKLAVIRFNKPAGRAATPTCNLPGRRGVLESAVSELSSGFACFPSRGGSYLLLIESLDCL